jgi:DNA recombination-dependent growth factor C
MGARKGSISYSLFHVDGEPPTDFREAYLDQIREFSFRALTPDSEEDASHGWSVLDDLLSAEFSRDNVFLGEYLCLGMRTDRWSLPGALLRAHVDRRVVEVKAEHSKAKLFRSEKIAIREEVTRQLKRKTLPSAAVVDMVWTLDRKEVRFWSQSSRALELFESLFESTFGLRLVPDNPYIAALNCGLSDTMVGRLGTVEQASFTSFE